MDAYSKMIHTLTECREQGTNLVYIPWAEAQCGAVSKYHGRVYSLSRDNSKYPVLPQFILETGCVVPPWGGAVGGPAFLFKGSSRLPIYYKGKDCPALKTSWRPFVDDRTEQDKTAYFELQKKILMRQYYDTNLNRYFRLRAAAPELCPRSLSTFWRWETTKPEKYQAIVSFAMEHNIPLPDLEFSPSDVVEPADPDPSYNGGRKRPLILL